MSLLTEFEPAQTFDGGLPSIGTFLEDATETFTQGQCVAADVSAGTAQEPSAADPVTDADLLGVASLNASGTTNFEMGIWLLDNRTVFRATQAGGAAPAVVDIFDLRDLAITAGVHEVHESASTQDHFQIVGITGTTTSDRYLIIGGLGATILSKLGI